MNAISVIVPYKFEGLWVFDDPHVELHREPFVSGADHVMDILAEGISSADKGIKLLFSAKPFPGHQTCFTRSRPEHGGYWYTWADRGVEGWLCPALFKYFESAPLEIYVQALAKVSAA